MTASTAEVVAAGSAGGRAGRSPTMSAFRLFLGTLVTRPRVIALTGLGVVAIALGLSLRLSNAVDPGRTAYDLVVSSYCLGLLAPVTALVFASAAFGDLAEDGTLVYVWLKPIARWRLVLAALAASLCVSLPVAVVPAALAAAVTGTGGGIIGGAAVSTTLATLGYTTLFLGLGLLVRRSLAWGLAYILIWENAVARNARGAARLAVQVYAKSVLARMAGRVAPKFGVHWVTAFVVVAVVAVAATAIAVRLLSRAEVP